MTKTGTKSITPCSRMRRENSFSPTSNTRLRHQQPHQNLTRVIKAALPIIEAAGDLVKTQEIQLDPEQLATIRGISPKGRENLKRTFMNFASQVDLAVVESTLPKAE